MSSFPGFGWLIDPPDFRDFFPECEEVQRLLALAPGPESPPQSAVDLREFFPPAFDQQGANASSAFACADVYEYFERRAHGRAIVLSRKFLYRNARALSTMCEHGPVDLRSTFKALVTFGGAPDQLWPDQAEGEEGEPPPLMYSFTREVESTKYVRLDYRNEKGAESLVRVKAFLAAGFPVAFGFSVPSTISQDGVIPYRPTFDAIRGGQAVVAVGYDDSWLGSTRGAILIRNSWGADWGDQGYAWLPYAFVENQLASSFWTMLSEAWMKSGEFFRPLLHDGVQAGIAPREAPQGQMQGENAGLPL